MIAGNLELAEMIQNYKPEDIGKKRRIINNHGAVAISVVGF